MQRIDVMFSQKIDEKTKYIVPIELKAVTNPRQISRYID